MSLRPLLSSADDADCVKVKGSDRAVPREFGMVDGRPAMAVFPEEGRWTTIVGGAEAVLFVAIN